MSQATFAVLALLAYAGAMHLATRHLARRRQAASNELAHNDQEVLR